MDLRGTSTSEPLGCCADGDNDNDEYSLGLMRNLLMGSRGAIMRMYPRLEWRLMQMMKAGGLSRVRVSGFPFFLSFLYPFLLLALVWRRSVTYLLPSHASLPTTYFHSPVRIFHCPPRLSFNFHSTDRFSFLKLSPVPCYYRLFCSSSVSTHLSR
jgi:hypothetical protein